MTYDQISSVLLEGFKVLAIVYFTTLNSSYLILNIIAFRALRVYTRQLKALDFEDLISKAGAPPLTLIAPGYNEEVTCVEAVKSYLLLKYSEYEILFVNDGSSDNTLTRLIEAFDLLPSDRAPTSNLHSAQIRGIYRSQIQPNFWVIDKENGGKADALNVGINYCRTPLFCAMDSDSLLERDALIRVVRPFLEDSRTVAAGGIIRIANGCTVKFGTLTDIQLPKNWLARFQVLEYLRAFMAGRMSWDVMKLTLVISGAFGVFRRSTVAEAGGYKVDTVGEDMELVVRLHRHCRKNKIPYRIAYVADPVAWTECPESFRVLGRQRDRWQRGLFESLFRHRGMLFNPRFGRIGMIAYPYFFIFELFGPFIELIGYITLVLAIVLERASGPYLLAFFSASIIYGIALSTVAVALEELSFRRYPHFTDLLRLFLLAILENFGYRQINSYWRIRGFFSGIFGKSGWGKMERKGFATETAA
ncbi:glycosyltransferase family 2 protein [Candidatus Neomarinimicrobiota bacterium]